MSKHVVGALKGGALVYGLLVVAAVLLGHRMPWEHVPATDPSAGFREMLVMAGMLAGGFFADELSPQRSSGP